MRVQNNNVRLDVAVTSSKTFTENQSAQLAYMIYLRFGEDYESAHCGWKRMLQNNCSLDSFKQLVDLGSYLL